MLARSTGAAAQGALDPERGGGARLAISNLTLRFGGVTALDTVTTEIVPGTVCGLIGPNGAGKTTLFNCVTRVFRPDHGSILVDGVELLDQRVHNVVRLGVARTFQNLALFEGLTVLENCLLGAHSRAHSGFLRNIVPLRSDRLRSRELQEESYALLDFLELADVAHHPAKGLPFGTLKRVELARALASRPRLLLLDEPASGLTHSEVRELSDILRETKDRFDLTVLIVEHHMGLVMGLCERIVVLDHGRKIAEGAPAEIQSDPEVIASYLGGPS